MKTNMQLGRINAVLDKKMRYSEGIMTRREWLNYWRVKGATVKETTRRNHAAEETLENWLYNNREDNSGNPNWPPTKRYLAKKAELKAGIFKTEYSLYLPDGKSSYDITKTEYEAFKDLELAEDINTQKMELSNKIEAGTATDEEIQEDEDKEMEFFNKYLK
jgi:hypothetical protein